MFIGLVMIIAMHVFSLIFETSANFGKSVKNLFPLQSLESSCPPVHSYWVMCTLRLSQWERQELSMHVICTCWFLYSFLHTCWVSNLIHTIGFVLISLLFTLVTVFDSQHPGIHDLQWIHPFPLFCMCGLPLAVRCLPPSLPYLPGISTACFLLWIFSFYLGFLNSGSGTWPTKAFLLFFLMHIPALSHFSIDILPQANSPPKCILYYLFLRGRVYVRTHCLL